MGETAGGQNAVLRLLLDEHLSPVIAQQVRARNPRISILSLHEWEAGFYLQQEDDLLLRTAHAQQLTLVTYDQRTILPLLTAWGEADIAHGGVVFVDTHTLLPNNFGGLVRALVDLWEAESQLVWTNRIAYLRKSQPSRAQ